MRKCKPLAALLILILAQHSIAAAEAEPTPKEILEKSCAIYSENWQGLRYHYTGGKDSFLKKCLAGIHGKNLVDGLWAIRSLIPDGHADFQIQDNETQSKTYPLLLIYDVIRKEVRVGAAFSFSFQPYVGKKVVRINGKPVMDVLYKRALLEPQSSQTNSLEIAARTLTTTFRKKPYPGFLQKMNFEFEGNSSLEVSAIDWKPLLNAKPFALSSNGYPSLWGAVDVSEEEGYCVGKREVAKSLMVKGKKWFLWHPRSLSFSLKEIEQAFVCWERGIRNADGVVLDLRDTSGGSLKQLYVLGYQFNLKMPSKVKRLISDGEISMKIIKEEGDTLGPKTEEGYIQELERKTPNVAKKVTPWKEKLVVITNGLCGSCCDMLVYYLQSRKDTCTYGTPTAGRLIGYDEVSPVSPESGVHIDLYVPMRENLKPDGNRWEGEPIVPKHLGSGGVMEALEACSEKSD